MERRVDPSFHYLIFMPGIGWNSALNEASLGEGEKVNKNNMYDK